MPLKIIKDCQIFGKIGSRNLEVTPRGYHHWQAISNDFLKHKILTFGWTVIQIYKIIGI